MPVTATPANWNKIAKAARPHIPPDYTGQIILHVHRGSVGRVEIRQTFKPDNGGA